MIKQLRTIALGIATIIVLAIATPGTPSATAQTPTPPIAPLTPSRAEVCAIVTSMPSAADPDGMLSLLDTTRQGVISDLEAMRLNMQRYDAEGYGWHNTIDDPSASEPKPGPWLIGALRMACEESSAAATVTGTVTYRPRIALPPDALVVVTLEDVSLADAPSTVIAGKTIRTAGQQVPIAFSLAYDPAEILPQHRYIVRAKIFYDDSLRWTSTTAYPVITQASPAEVEIEVQQI